MLARVAAVMMLSLVAAARAAPWYAQPLKAEEVALVVNANDQDGRALAQHYARVRGVPAQNVVELDLPAGDVMSVADYEAKLREPLAAQLRARGLEAAVRCVVPVYGVPLRTLEPNEEPPMRRELDELARELGKLTEQIAPRLAQLEALAAEAKPGFAPASGDRAPQALVARAQAAEKAIHEGLPTTRPTSRPALAQRLQGLSQALLAEPLYRATQPVPANQVGPTLQALAQKGADDPKARADARDLALRQLGFLPALAVLEGQRLLLAGGNVGGSVDSELSLLWQPFGPRAGPVPNLLKFDAPAVPAGTPRQLLVCRLDAPTADLARQLVDECARVEQLGLRGAMVVDARGIAGKKPDGTPDGYGWYDDALRRLAALKTSAAVPRVELDDKPEVLPAHSFGNVALYAGWYQLRHYQPSVKLAPGAVAVHTASFELVSLHDPTERGWCRGLMLDGAAATVGAVGEPYLQAFPHPDQFYGLLMTGRFTLAEAYWLTTPWASWRVTVVGDPLYKPFAAGPAARFSDLAPALGAVGAFADQ